MIIGLTGQTGSGKSTLCDILKDNGFYICSCDEIAKEVRSDAKTAIKIADAFGEDIITEDGTIDKKLLAARAFSSREQIKKLNDIMHPAILALSFERINKALESGYRYAVLDAPQLFESGADKKCDFIVSLIADKETRLKRILSRDNISSEEALSRISVQLDEDYFKEKSDYIIENNEEGGLYEKALSFISYLNNYKT